MAYDNGRVAPSQCWSWSPVMVTSSGFGALADASARDEKATALTKNNNHAWNWYRLQLYRHCEITGRINTARGDDAYDGVISWYDRCKADYSGRCMDARAEMNSIYWR